MLNTDYEKKADFYWSDFIRERILREKKISLKVATDSMLPLISPIDRVIIKGCRVEDLKSGDIVLFERDSTLHVHRLLVKRFRDREFVLVPKADRAFTVEESFSKEQFLGKVIRIIKKSGTIDLERQPGRTINRLFYLLSLLKTWTYVLTSHFKRRLKCKVRNEDLLIRCCATTNVDKKARLSIQRILSQNLDWDYFLKQVQKEDTSSLIHKTFLKIDGIEARAPRHIRSFLKDSYYAVLAKNISLLQSLEKIALSFKKQGIEAIIFKGIMLAELIYKDIGLRPMGDIDLLIKKEHVIKADNILRQLGYSIPFAAKDFDGFSPGQYRNSFLYRSADTISSAVHIHWHVVNFSPYHESIIQKIDIARVWRESTAIRLGKADLRTFSLHHQIIFLCMHALNHSFSPLVRLCDIKEFLRLEKEKINWDRLVEESFEFNLSRHVYYVLYLVSVMLKAEIPEDVLDRLKPKRISIFERKFISAVLAGTPILTGEWLMCFGMNETLKDRFLFLRRLLFPPQRELALIRKKGAAQINLLDYPKRLSAGFGCAVRVMFNFTKQSSIKM